MPDLRPVVQENQVLTLLKQHFPTPITNLVPVEGGSVARTFAFRTGEQEYIIRFNLDKMLGSNFPKEAYVWRKLASTPIPIPPIIQVGRMGELHFAISQKMPGKMLTDHTPTEAVQMFPQIMEILHAIHQIDVSDTQGYGVFNYQGKASVPSWTSFLRKVVDEEVEQDYYGKWHVMFDDTFLERDVFESIYQHMVRLLAFCPEQRYLVYGGASMNNMLAQDGKITAVLDWLDAKYGDFVFDIAVLDYWYPWLQVQERAQHFYQEHQVPIPAYTERILCYQCYQTLDAMRFYTKSNQEKSYQWVRTLMLEKLQKYDATNPTG